MADETLSESIEELRDEARKLMLQSLVVGLRRPRRDLDVNKVRAVAEAYAFITAVEQKS